MWSPRSCDMSWRAGARPIGFGVWRRVSRTIPLQRSPPAPLLWPLLLDLQQPLLVPLPNLQRVLVLGIRWIQRPIRAPPSTGRL
jgi:hypothetical protein